MVSGGRARGHGRKMRLSAYPLLGVDPPFAIPSHPTTPIPLSP
jgi:hypothetical protein